MDFNTFTFSHVYSELLKQQLIGETLNMFITIYLYLQFSHNVRTGIRNKNLVNYM